MNDSLSEEKLSEILQIRSDDPTRILRRESTWLEFKETYNHANMASYFKAIASFANSKGGYIVFGIQDSPRKLLGLQGKSLDQFESLQVELFTKNLLDYFAPEIKWEHITFTIRDQKFGVIYTYPLDNKPCICKKNYTDKNPKYSLKEGEVYYRYGGRSEKIRYPELRAIIEENRKQEERQWLRFVMRAARIGIGNASILDLSSGEIVGKGGTVVIDEGLLSKISFIKEGQFVENGGHPTLKLIGDVQSIEPGKLVVSPSSHKEVKFIGTEDVVRGFLAGSKADYGEAQAALKAVATALSANYPIYSFLWKGRLTMAEAISYVSNLVTRKQAKRKLLERLGGKRVSIRAIPDTGTKAAKEKSEYKRQWLGNQLALSDERLALKYCLEGLLALSDDEIRACEIAIRAGLTAIFQKHIKEAPPEIVSTFRISLCRVDEVVYLPKIR